MTAITFNATVKNHQLTAFSTWQGRRALFSVNLRNRPSLYLNNACLMARMQYGEEILLWSALDTGEAERLLDAVTQAMKQDAQRKTILKSSLTLIAAALIFSGAYVSTHNLSSNDNPPPFVQAQPFAHNPAFTQTPPMPDLMPLASQREAMNQPMATQAQTAQQQATPDNVPAGPAQAMAQPTASQGAQGENTAEEIQAVETKLASNLGKAAGRKLFTVPLSSGHERTLFVFADPNCPNCQNLEPLFEALSTQYNVQVFPTTAFGGDESAKLIKPVLCLPPEQRKAAWQKLFSVDDGMLNPHGSKEPKPEAAPADCDIAGKALGVNDVAFKTYHFPGTPWVISDDGRHVPQAVMRNPDEMIKFMSERPEK